MKKKSLGKNVRKRVLYIVEDAESTQFRYQVQNVIEATEGGKYEVDWLKTDEIMRGQKKIDAADLVVILRQAAKGNKLVKMIEEVRKKGKKVLFSLDDLVFDYRDLPILMKATNSRNVAYWIGYFWGVRRIAKRVDGFVVTNEFLGQKLGRTFGKPYVVIKNSLNRGQVEVADKCVSEKNEGWGGERKFRIGYFSGSPTHARDLRMVESEIIEFLEKHDDAELEVVGYMKFSDEMRKMIEKGKVRVKPLVDYEELEKEMAGVDVNIAPLVVNDFTNCKSELKFFEAGVVETTTIASPTYTFRKAIIDGENGFLAQPGEWYDKLEYLYQHPEENRRIAKKAREYALKHYYGKEFLGEVEGAFNYFGK